MTDIFVAIFWMSIRGGGMGVSQCVFISSLSLTISNFPCEKQFKCIWSRGNYLSFWTELLQWGLGQSSQLPLSTCLFRWHPQEFHSRGPDLGQPSQVPHPTCYLSWHPQECNLRESLTWVSLALLYCTSGVRPAGRRQLQRIVLASKILIEGGQDDEDHSGGLGDHLCHCWGREDQEGHWWVRQDHCCP